MLVLVGLMGAGKSSVGKMLSEYLNVGFIDADQEDSVGGNMPYCQTNNILEYLFPGREMVINHVQ